MSFSNETDTCEVRIVRESAKAYLLESQDQLDKCDDEEDAQAWFPKSQISFPRCNTKTKLATAEIPVWLLKEKGWIA